MHKVISSKDRSNIEHFLNQLDSGSLLHDGESVLEGCYPILIKNRKYYCLFTDSQLILAARKGLFVPNKLLLFPFRYIDKISLDIYRHPIYFMMYMVLLPIYMLSYSLFMFFEETRVLYWILLIVLFIIIPFTGYYFFKGEDVVLLKVPDKNLSLRRAPKYNTFYGAGDLYFFEIDEESSRIDTKKGDLKDLYSVLVSYWKSS